MLIEDINGCDTLVQFVILEPDSIEATLDIQNASCVGDCDGAVTAAIIGGTAPYSYDWQPAPTFGQGTDQASGFCPGNYNLEVTDDNGCVSNFPFSISGPSPFTIAVNQTDPSCGPICDGTADLQVSGSNGSVSADYTYLWTPAPVVDKEHPVLPDSVLVRTTC